MYCWVNSPQPSLVTSVSSREAKLQEQNAKEDRDKNTKKHHTNTRKSQMNKKGKPTKPNRTEGSEAGRTKQGRKDAGEEGKRRPAEKEREDAREGSRIRREKPHRSRRRARAALPVCRCERHLNNTYNMVERAKPTGPKPLLPGGGVKTGQSATTHHIEGMTTGPLQIQPDIRRGPAEH